MNEFENNFEKLSKNKHFAKSQLQKERNKAVKTE